MNSNRPPINYALYFSRRDWPVILTKWDDFADKTDLKKQVKLFFTEKFVDTGLRVPVETPSGIIHVGFSNSGYKHFVASSTYDKFQLVQALPDILQKAIYRGKEKPQSDGRSVNVAAYWYFDSFAVLNYKEIAITITVQERNDGSFLYHFSSWEFEPEALKNALSRHRLDVGNVRVGLWSKESVAQNRANFAPNARVQKKTLGRTIAV